MDTFYKELEISNQSTIKEVRTQYLKMSRKYHPDKNPGDMECENKMKRINLAYSEIINSVLSSKKDKRESSACEGGCCYMTKEKIDEFLEEIFPMFKNQRLEEIRYKEHLLHSASNGNKHSIDKCALFGLKNKFAGLKK